MGPVLKELQYNTIQLIPNYQFTAETDTQDRPTNRSPQQHQAPTICTRILGEYSRIRDGYSRGTPLRICVWIWLYRISDSVIKLPHHVAHLCGNYSENRSQIGEKIRGTACAVEQSSKRSSGSNNMHIRPGDLAKSNCWPQCPTEREPQFSVSVASLTKSRALRM